MQWKRKATWWRRIDCGRWICFGGLRAVSYRKSWPGNLKIDMDFRNLNFGRAAERELQEMNPESRKLLEAYARGVNRFIEQHRETLPMEFTLLKYKPQPWQPTDSLVLAGYMYRTLTDTREREIHRGVVAAKARPGTCQGSFQRRILDGSFCGWRSKCEGKSEHQRG